MTAIRIKELAEIGLVYISYPPELRAAMAKAMESWRVFYALPDEQKLRFGYIPDAKTSGNGYELKGKAGDVDRKENIHLRPIVRDELMEAAHRVDSVIAPRFIEDALALNPLIAPLLRAFGEAVEREYDVPGFADDIMAKQSEWLLRFLHYPGGRKVGEVIAHPHVDKGGFSLHLDESHGGVQRLSYGTREWEPMPLSHKETAIFTGTGLQHRSQCRLRALSHRVVAVPGAAEEGRDSAVCFVDFAHRRYFNKEKFGSQQDWAPGAFYDMPFEEYDKLFID
ncbi:MAG TPA: hypothetical protein VEB18_01550 [Candidatus Paceibacterota bacterium]|nr:hypothetical protein [Candidatus Paceibacterota bacterium]